MTQQKQVAEKPKNLLQRINDIRSAVAYVQKDKEVSTGRGSYKAVTHDMVTAILRKHMIEHGVVCIPTLVESSTVQLPAAEGKTPQIRYEATYDFTFANVDVPEDTIHVRIQAHAMDNADKAPGKAISYAKKYAVLKLFELETGEDEESRVQDVDTEFHVESIRAAKDLDTLRTLFATAFSAAEKDKEARKAIIKAKDERKAELSKVPA